MTYSGSGDVTAPVTALPGPPVDQTPGAMLGRLRRFPGRRSPWSGAATCTFAIKAQNAEGAGALAVVIVNNVAGDLNGTLGEAFALDIPVTSVTQAVGHQLAATGGLVMQLETATFRGSATTYNVIAETPTGAPTTSSWPARTSTRSTRGRASTTTAPGRRAPRSRRADGQGQAAQHGALRLVGRGGAEPDRLDPTSMV